jgi:heme/copper-type cytochrome/quinol oxidase subunit 2
MAQGDYFHDHTMLVLVITMGLLGAVNVDLLRSGVRLASLSEHPGLELLWTITPGVLLLGVAWPSLKLLYLMDDRETPEIRLAVQGSQWFWGYRLSGFEGARFDSYIAPWAGGSRALDVDSRVVLPSSTAARVLVTSSDVLHA